MTHAFFQRIGDEILSWFIQRVTFGLGQAIAIHVTGDSAATNNGTFYLHTDHLGSTSYLTKSTGGKVNGSDARYQPFGPYRTTPTQTITDTGYTGQHHNPSLGLIYFNSRYYAPSLARFISPDTIVPAPTNPQTFNRYAYVLNNPTRFTDPTGHICYDPDTDAATPGNCNGGSTPVSPPTPSPAPPPQPACDDIWCQPSPDDISDSSSTPCTESSCDKAIYKKGQYGEVWAAYEVYQELKELMGDITYQELLALLIQAEFGTIEGESFNSLVEALTRQFFHYCPGGICVGHSLWLFLGALEAWYAGSVIDSFLDGSYQAFLQTAQNALNNSRWQTGQQTDRPWTWGSPTLIEDTVFQKMQNDYSFTVGSTPYTLGVTVINANMVLLTLGQKVAWQQYNQCLAPDSNCILP